MTDRCSWAGHVGLTRRRFLGMGTAALAVLSRDAAAFAGPPRLAGSQRGELAQAERLASLCTASNAIGIGLMGEYFRALSFRGKPVLTRIDSTIDFDESMEWPKSAPFSRAASVRWTGWVKAPLAGAYLLHLSHPDATVKVSRQEMVKAGVTQASIEMAPGRYYPISVEIESLKASFARFRLEWTAPHGARYVVPRALLHPPTDTAPSVPAATPARIEVVHGERR
jgi:hypothetical protein